MARIMVLDSRGVVTLDEKSLSGDALDQEPFARSLLERIVWAIEDAEKKDARNQIDGIASYLSVDRS